MQHYLQQDIQFLQGVGPKRAELLRDELGIKTFEDLLTHYPYRYVDRSRFYRINEVTSDMPFIQIRGKIHGYASIGKGRGKRLVADFRDETGRIDLVWFKGAKWIPENYPVGKELVVFGRPSVYSRKLNLVHPDLEDAWTALAGARVFAFTAHARTSFDDIRYTPGDVLMFGPEPTGLDEATLADERITAQVRIPMLPGRRSLNLSNAAAVAAYEAWRQVGYTGSV